MFIIIIFVYRSKIPFINRLSRNQTSNSMDIDATELKNVENGKAKSLKKYKYKPMKFEEPPYNEVDYKKSIKKKHLKKRIPKEIDNFCKLTFFLKMS